MWENLQSAGTETSLRGVTEDAWASGECADFQHYGIYSVLSHCSEGMGYVT